MDPTTISRILKELDLKEDDVTNIYHHGSWVYGSNTSESDRDLMLVTRSPVQQRIRFFDDFNYFHELKLHNLWNKYDVCIYSVENFEILIEKNYFVAVQCLFLPDQFKIKEEIDFRKIYLENYYNPFRIKQVAVYIMSKKLELYYSKDYPRHPIISSTDDHSHPTISSTDDHSHPTISSTDDHSHPTISSTDDHRYPVVSSKRVRTKELHEDDIFKNLFHGVRYLDFAEQLLQTKSIFDFTRATYIFQKMKTIRQNSSDLKPVVEFVRTKAFEYKTKLEKFNIENIIKGEFEAQITFANTEDALDLWKKACENTRYKFLLNKRQQLQISSIYEGEYPSIAKQIENEVRDHFKGFEIIRIKIQSSSLNKGVPQYDFEKNFLWDNQTNYFQLTYKFLLVEDIENSAMTLRKLCEILFKNELYSSHIFIHENQFILTRYLFNVGQMNALRKDEEIQKYFFRTRFSTSEKLCKFIVYDTNVEFDNE